VKKQLIVWALAATTLGFGYLLYEMYSSAKEDCNAQPYVSGPFYASARK